MARGAGAHSGDRAAAQGEEGGGREEAGTGAGTGGHVGGGANEIYKLAPANSSSS